MAVRRTHRPARRGAGRVPGPARPRPPQIRCHAARITTACRTRCSPPCAASWSNEWDDRLAEAARDAVDADRRGDARRRRRREGPAVLRRHGDRAHPRHPRRLGGPAAAGPPAVLPPRPVRHRPGAAVAAAVALPEPVDSRRPRRRHRVPRPLGAGRHGQHRRSSARPGRATGGGCPTRTAACTSTATAATC